MTKHSEVASSSFLTHSLSLSLPLSPLVSPPSLPPLSHLSPSRGSVRLGWFPCHFPRGSYIGPGTWRAAALARRVIKRRKMTAVLSVNPKTFQVEHWCLSPSEEWGKVSTISVLKDQAPPPSLLPSLPPLLPSLHPSISNSERKETKTIKSQILGSHCGTNVLLVHSKDKPSLLEKVLKDI